MVYVNYKFSLVMWLFTSGASLNISELVLCMSV